MVMYTPMGLPISRAPSSLSTRTSVIVTPPVSHSEMWTPGICARSSPVASSMARSVRICFIVKSSRLLFYVSMPPRPVFHAGTLKKINV